MNERITVLASLLLALAGVGCTSAHAVPDPELHAVVPPTEHTPLAPVVNLDSCFTGSGALVELAAVNNNDQHDHGTLLTFGISPSGVVAAAGADGTLKFWTMDATLVGVADPAILTYGPEIGGAPITDLAFTEELAIAGDIRGLVQELGPAGTADVVGGTNPDVPIASVAFDRSAGRLAHAQGGALAPDVLPLIVKSLDGAERWNVTETLASITDLAFAADGALVIGGNDGSHAALEIRDAADPMRVLSRPDVGRDASVVELAAAREGATLVVATTHSLIALDGNMPTLLATSEAGFRSVDLTPGGDYAMTVDVNGLVSVRSTIDGHEVATTTIARGLGVRIDATGQRAVVGGQDAMLHVLSCR